MRNNSSGRMSRCITLTSQSMPGKESCGRMNTFRSSISSVWYVRLECIDGVNCVGHEKKRRGNVLVGEEAMDKLAAYDVLKRSNETTARAWKHVWPLVVWYFAEHSNISKTIMSTLTSEPVQIDEQSSKRFLFSSATRWCLSPRRPAHIICFILIIVMHLWWFRWCPKDGNDHRS